jgi:cytochrome c oxidase subunit 2
MINRLSMMSKKLVALGLVFGAGTMSLFAQTAESSGSGSRLITLLLIVAAGILVLVTISRTARLAEMVNEVKGVKARINFNKFNGILMLGYMVLFLGGTIWEMFYHGSMLLPESASAHGVLIDSLFNITFGITVVVFVMTHILLFYFTYKYHGTPERKALFYPVNDKLELVWTIFPAIVLAVLVSRGMSTWRGITNVDTSESLHIEVYAFQFDWLTRYPGADDKLGKANFNYVSGTNGVGIISEKDARAKLVELEDQINIVKARIEKEKVKQSKLYKIHENYEDEFEEIQIDIYELERSLELREKHIIRINQMKDTWTDDEITQAGKDDIIDNVLYVPLGKQVTLNFTARDVIHSAYMPHFRLQMNCVPGLPTKFTFTPTITTEEMRVKLNNEAFDYTMACAKICGNAHFTMKMIVVVLEEEEFNKWHTEQTPYYVAQYEAKTEAPTETAALEVIQ